jgi:PLP dependent protein
MILVSIAEHCAAIKQRIEAAALRVRRPPEEITLMAVTKTFPPASIRQAYDSGLRIFGESKVQEFAGKAKVLNGLHEAEFHMIGHLQTNKAAKAVELFGAIDSLDSLRLAEKLDSAAAAAGKQLRILIEINIGGEQAKSGVAPDSEELEDILQSAARLKHLAIHGLMTVPPFTEDPEGSRPYFRKLRELRDQIAARALPSISMDVLSMGMSQDFEVAIEEGSTCVRVGTAIFGGRIHT